jgi:hypothetical protein
MITLSENRYILDHAYVPEHLPHYVSAISRTEPFLVDDFVVYVRDVHLILIGYPLSGTYNESQLLETLTEAKARFKPEVVSLIAPEIPSALNEFKPSPYDAYYRIERTQLAIPQKTRNMLSRARQEISIKIGCFGREHKKLTDAFLRKKRFDQNTRFIFQHIKEYARCETALLFEARTQRGDLVAFDVAEFGAKNYAFYMFNVRSPKHNFPGVSDLLLAQIIEQAKEAGQRYINLGLGINPGVAFFKKKWGAVPFLGYVVAEQKANRQEAWGELFDQLSGL